MAGRVRSFSDLEIETLRALARKLKADRGWSQAQLGAALGIAQQNAGRFVAAGSKAGMDRTTANQLATLCGYRDVEHALIEEGVLAEMQPLPTGTAWGDRDTAMRVALRLGYPQAIVDSVAHRYSAPEYRHKPLRWWMDMIGMESVMHSHNAPAPVPVATTPPPASIPVASATRSSGVAPRRHSSKKRSA
jgi:hypothetical protein